MAQLSDALLQKISTVPEITPVNAGSLLTGLKAGQELRGGQLQNQVRESALFTEEQKQVVLGNKIEQTAEDKKNLAAYTEETKSILEKYKDDLGNPALDNELLLSGLKYSPPEKASEIISAFNKMSEKEKMDYKQQLAVQLKQTPGAREPKEFAKKEFKQINDELTQMEADGETGTKAYARLNARSRKLSTVTGQLEGDINTLPDPLSPRTKAGAQKLVNRAEELQSGIGRAKELRTLLGKTPTATGIAGTVTENVVDPVIQLLSLSGLEGFSTAASKFAKTRDVSEFRTRSRLFVEQMKKMVSDETRFSDQDQIRMNEAAAILEIARSPASVDAALETIIDIFNQDLGRAEARLGVDRQKNSIPYQTPDGKNYTFPDKKSLDAYLEAGGQ